MSSPANETAGISFGTCWRSGPDDTVAAEPNNDEYL